MGFGWGVIVGAVGLYLVAHVFGIPKIGGGKV